MTRPVARVVPAVHALEGEGFEVHRPFPTPAMEMLDPFLLLDEMGPQDHPPGTAQGAPDHPHRGFETVTYMLEGEMEHADSMGNRGVIRPGGVQWMTAGSGVIHSEMPTAEARDRGGRAHGFQLWVNLPADAKMIPPRYQGIEVDEIPVAELPGATVRVISGTFAGVDGPADTHSPITYLHVHLEPGARLAVDAPSDANVGAYVFAGALDRAPAQHLVVYRDGPGGVELVATGAGADVLVLVGVPLREPVARYGPFVMSSREQLVEAIEDYQAGRFVAG